MTLADRLRLEGRWVRLPEADERVEWYEALVWGGQVFGAVEVFKATPGSYYGGWSTGHSGAHLTRGGARRAVVDGVAAMLSSPSLCPVEGVA